MKSGITKNSVALIAGLSLSVLSTACGKTAFNASNTSQDMAAGSATVPAKVDVLLVTNDTGSAFEGYSEIKKQVPAFLGNLDKTGWDYHFANIPLTKFRAITQVAGSKFDSNRSDWTPAFPGQSANSSGMINSSAFRTPGNFDQYVDLRDISNSSAGVENGFENIANVLSSGLGDSRFMRKDAMLVILVVGTGDDTSGVNYCRRADGVTVACNDSSEATSFNQYVSYFKNLKRGNVRFYAAVSPSQTSDNSCMGTPAFAGSRYIRMAAALGGKSFNICNQSISSVLTSLTSELRTSQMSFSTRYLFLDQEPNLNTLTITKFKNGSAAQATVIPQDAINGWTYAGYVSNVYTIDAPVAMNLASGYAIELHGSAKLIGMDTASVDFKLAGAQNSVSK